MQHVLPQPIANRNQQLCRHLIGHRLVFRPSARSSTHTAARKTSPTAGLNEPIQDLVLFSILAQLPLSWL
jgi:hypothetical protein